MLSRHEKLHAADYYVVGMTAATKISDELASESEPSIAHEATAESEAPAPATEPETLPTAGEEAEPVAPAPAPTA